MNWQAGNQQERLESYLGTITFFYSVFNHKYLIVPFLRGTFFMFLFFIKYLPPLFTFTLKNVTNRAGENN
jgi:hypothetical protein